MLGHKEEIIDRNVRILKWVPDPFYVNNIIL